VVILWPAVTFTGDDADFAVTIDLTGDVSEAPSR
jgi:hypothetical protein